LFGLNVNKMRLSAVVIIVLLTFTLVYAVTLTADAAESVIVPKAALGKVCLVDEFNECTTKKGEILFGNAVVRNFNGDEIGLILIQLGGQLYRSNTDGLVFEYTVKTTENETLVVDGVTLSGMENVESSERGRLLGIKGTLSQVLYDGNEIYTTGEVRVLSDGTEVPIPVGEFYITYDGLVVESSDVCGEYSYLDKRGNPVKGLSTRECTGKRGVMTAGEYRDLKLYLNQPGGVVDTFKLLSLGSTTSFEWKPSAVEEEVLEK